MPSQDQLRKLVGQLFLIGFDGYSVPDDFRKLVSDYYLGGVIYFKRNVQSAGQLAELSNDLQFSCRAKSAAPLFVSIDHEGGKVNRLVKPFTKFPGNDHIGELGSPKIGYDFGAVLATELTAVGINVNFAPVIDVYTNPNNTVIRNRAFSSDAEICARMGSAVSRGLQRTGVMSVGKHFPGHGDVKEDSHHALPKCDKDWDTLEKIEMIPFRKAIRSRIDGLMTAHILNKALDDKYPATLSASTLEYLRSELRFSGVLFSDDMEMKGITGEYSQEEAAVLAVKAGCDVLIYRGDKEPVKAVEAVIKAVEDGQISEERLQDSIRRIERAKRKYCKIDRPVDITKVGSSIGLPEHFQLADVITKKELPPDYQV